MTQSLQKLDRWHGNFPGEHEFSTLEDMEPTDPVLDVIDVVHVLTEKWQGNKFAGLYMYGQPGTGKTHAAIGLGRELHDSGAEVTYCYVPELVLETGTRVVSGWTGTRYNATTGANNVSAAFPGKYDYGLERNPRTALILDDYRPEFREHSAAAIEAAAQFGGLIIMTSNHPDPFKLTEAPQNQLSTTELAAEELAKHLNPERYEQAVQDRTAKEREFSDSLRSRIAAGFKFIEFTGSDRRAQHSIWG